MKHILSDVNETIQEHDQESLPSDTFVIPYKFHGRINKIIHNVPTPMDQNSIQLRNSSSIS